VGQFFLARRKPGFTLIELLVVLSVVAIILSVAAPPLRQLLQSNLLRTETRRLLVAINLARSEAIARNQPVSLCPSSIATSGPAVCSGNYAGGWMVFSNRDRDRTVDVSTDVVIEAFAGLPTGFTLTNRAGTRDASELITYLPDGSSGRNLTLKICSGFSAAAASWSVVMSRVGRPRVARGWGECPTG
jgi:type IV fimbrial biogenesis protein FimT